MVIQWLALISFLHLAKHVWIVRLISTLSAVTVPDSVLTIMLTLAQLVWTVTLKIVTTFVETTLQYVKTGHPLMLNIVSIVHGEQCRLCNVVIRIFAIILFRFLKRSAWIVSCTLIKPVDLILRCVQASFTILLLNCASNA